MKKTKSVIGGWLSEEEGATFAEYASQIGIDAAALATLLLMKELSEGKLGATRKPVINSPVRKGRRVTARTSRLDLKQRFNNHAAAHGLSSDAAAAAVFRTELQERWLGKCVGLFRESS
ncbi:hypothetical protein [Qipengyuania pacifica]|uniref:hypothetical protein n=1 Tax=Qipengyuania pacifica TaxID=2860199 RepID=UPI001C9D7445|nr:hypothetical protein [Qipengyuania pacifica]MBY8332388.1 hypothetical protein [Qipengyuania pacifica]